MVRINGIGTSLLGSRDYDASSRSYVTNLVFTILWVPVWVLAAYRVIPAGGNSYHFLGREPVSKAVRLTRKLTAACLIAGITSIMLLSYKTSDGYVTSRKLKSARAQIEAGDLAVAASTLLPLCDHPKHGSEAFALLKQTADTAWGKTGTANQALSEAHSIARDPTWQRWFPDFAERLQAAALLHTEDAPKVALDLVRLAITRRGNTPVAQLEQTRKEIASQWWRRAPGDVNAVCEYVVGLDEEKQVDELRKLLKPHQQDPALAGTEAARILGGILFADGDYATARNLLQSYITPRMREFHAAEKNYLQTVEQRQETYLNMLDQNLGPRDFYQKYQAADKDGQIALVNAYLTEKFSTDKLVQQALDRQEQAGRMVPSVMQLGIAELNLSHDASDPATRRDLLKSAEQTFLAIRGAAGESDEFRLFMGEISYWLGKHAEGRQLFDELLTSHKRANEWLFQVACRLREIGEVDQARSMLEEAWNAESDPTKKHMLAGTRQVMFIDTADKQKWLNRCDTTQPNIKAELHSAAGDLANEAGRMDEAAKEYRLAAEEYTHMQESSTRLNNEALVWQRLAMLTGSAADYRKAVDNIARASHIEPNSVLLGNLGSSYLTLANWETNEKLLDLAYVPDLAGSNLSASLARTADEFRAATAELTNSPHTKEAKKALAHALVMSPKDPGLYAQMAGFEVAAENHAAIQSLLEKARAAAIDHHAARERARPKFAGEITAAERQSLAASLARKRAALKSLPATVKPATRIMLEIYVIGLENSARKRDGDAPVAPLLERARALHKSAACGATGRLLTTLMCDAALEKLTQQPAANAIYQLNRWQLEPPDIITLLLLHEPTSAATAAQPLVLEALELLEERTKVDGNEVSLQRWLWTSRIKPAEADRLKRLILASAFKQAVNELEYELAPYNPESILYRNLMEILRGHPEEGAKFLAAAAADGIRILPK